MLILVRQTKNLKKKGREKEMKEKKESKTNTKSEIAVSILYILWAASCIVVLSVSFLQNSIRRETEKKIKRISKRVETAEKEIAKLKFGYVHPKQTLPED